MSVRSEAENAIVQSIFEYPDLQPRIFEGFKADYFADPQIAIVFTAAAQIHNAGRTADALAVRDLLEEKQDISPPWLYEFLETTDQVRTKLDAPWYIHGWKQIVHDQWRKDEFQRALSNPTSTAELEKAASDLLNNATQFGGVREVALSKQIDELLSFQRRIWEGSQPEGFTWGLKPLDDQMLLEPGKQYVVGGSKGTSKTKLAINVMDENITRGVKCLFYSMEMGARDVLRRIASRRTSIDSSLILRRAFSDDQFGRVTRSLDELRGQPLVLDTSSHLTRSEIVRGIGHWKERHEVADDNGLVVIDFLQRISSDIGRREETDATALRDTAYALAGAAKEHRVSVLLVAQLNKQADGHCPEIGHLEGSGGPAQAADGLILLDLLKTRAAGKDPIDGKDQLDIIVAKCREGESGKTIPCMVDLRIGRYYERIEGEEPGSVTVV